MTTYISCRYLRKTAPLAGEVSIKGRCEWSQEIDAAGVTDGVAPPARENEGTAFFTIENNSVAVFYATGPNPDATKSPRTYLPANRPEDVEAHPGDKVAILPIAAPSP